MKEKVSRLYMLLGITMISCLLIANIAAAKMIQVGPWSLTAGILIFPFTYIIGDILTEVYGFKAARFIIWMGFSMNLLMVSVFSIAIMLPAPVWFDKAEPFRAILGSTPRILVASLSAFLVGSNVNAWVMARMKPADKSTKGYAVRSIVSSIFGQALDSCIFLHVAFFGIMPYEQLPRMILLQVTVKLSYEVILLPLSNYLVSKANTFEHAVK